MLEILKFMFGSFWDYLLVMFTFVIFMSIITTGIKMVVEHWFTCKTFHDQTISPSKEEAKTP